MSNEVMECLVHVTPRSCAARLSRHGIRFPNHGMCNEVTECLIREISKAHPSVVESGFHGMYNMLPLRQLWGWGSQISNDIAESIVRVFLANKISCQIFVIVVV